MTRGGDVDTFGSASEHARAFRTGTYSPLDLAEACLARIERLDPSLRSFIAVTRERALGEAARATVEIASGGERSPLHGIPYAVKDQMSVAGCRLTAGSRVLDDRVEDRDATVVARLADAGAVLLGTLNTHEFHMGPTRSFPFGVPRNPWHLDHSPGASSSGSGAAVAAGLCTFTLGGDTGGSIRGPAALCGVVGLKATWGRVSRAGVVPLAPSLDCIGPLAARVEDVALALETLAGADPDDSTSSLEAVDAYAADDGRDVGGARVGLVEELLDPAVLGADAVAATYEAVDVLRSLGVHVETIRLPLVKVAPGVSRAVLSSEAFGYHRQMLQRRYAAYDANTRIGLATAAALPTGVVSMAFRMRTLIASQVSAALTQFDALLGSAGRSAPRIESAAQPTAARPMPPQWQAFNLSGHPAISVPSRLGEDGLPLGVQFAGRHFGERSLLGLARAFERSNGWQVRVPSGLE